MFGKKSVVFVIAFLAVIFISMSFVSAFSFGELFGDIFGGDERITGRVAGNEGSSSSSSGGSGGSVSPVLSYSFDLSSSRMKNGASVVGSGVGGKAASLDGVDDYVESVSVSLDDEVSVMGWFKTDAYTSQGSDQTKQDKNEITGSWISNRDSGVILDPEMDGSVKMYVNLVGLGWYSTSTGPNSISLNEWAHWAGVYDGSSIRLYKNGELASARSVSGSLSGSGNFCIGQDCGVSNRFFDGSVDEVKVYDVAVSAEKIDEIYGNEITDLVESGDDGDDGRSNTQICVSNILEPVSCEIDDVSFPDALAYEVSVRHRRTLADGIVDLASYDINVRSGGLQTENSFRSIPGEGDISSDVVVVPKNWKDDATASIKSYYKSGTVICQSLPVQCTLKSDEEDSGEACGDYYLNVVGVDRHFDGKLRIGYEAGGDTGTLQFGLAQNSDDGLVSVECIPDSFTCGEDGESSNALCTVITNCNYPVDEGEYLVKVSSEQCSGVFEDHVFSVGDGDSGGDSEGACSELIDLDGKYPGDLEKEGYVLEGNQVDLDGFFYGVGADSYYTAYYNEKENSYLYSSVYVLDESEDYKGVADRFIEDMKENYVWSIEEVKGSSGNYEFYTVFYSEFDVFYLWSNENVIVILSSYSREGPNSLKSADDLIEDLKSNDFELFEGYEGQIGGDLEEFAESYSEICPSGLSDVECYPELEQKLEPAICPEYGSQTLIVRDLNGCIDSLGKGPSEYSVACSPGICSGCMVPRWMGYENGDNVCVPYSTRLGFEEANNDRVRAENEIDSNGNGLTLGFTEDFYGLPFVNISIHKRWNVIREYEMYPHSEEYSVDLGEEIIRIRVDNINFVSKGSPDNYADLVLLDGFDAYCNYDGGIRRQAGDDAECQNDYECFSNECSAGYCVNTYVNVVDNAGLLKQIWCRLINIGSEEGYLQCLNS